MTVDVEGDLGLESSEEMKRTKLSAKPKAVRTCHEPRLGIPESYRQLDRAGMERGV